MVFIVRIAEPKDEEDIYNLAQSAQLFNLPADKDAVKDLIALSKKTATSDLLPKTEAQYVFALENLETKKVIGTGQVKAQKTHEERANYTFKILQAKKESHSLGISVDHKKLKLIADWEPLTELGGLVIEQSFQGSPYSLGKLLSFARLFYIVQFSKRFNERLYVEIAPKSNALWESLSSKFIPLTYKEADVKSKENQEFFSALLPKEDIYLTLLSKQAQKDIAQAPAKSLPAMKLLEKAGFVYSDEVDPFDGGICLRAQIKHLFFYNSIFQTTIYSMDDLNKVDKNSEDTDKKFFVSVGDAKSFRCVLIRPSKVFYVNSKVQICCEKEILNALQVKSGESVTAFSL
ncbi:MAG: arginine N-succinyltransferase [Bdellovibrionaceae bacterium]|nr:arginine N-succinyltransferase [Pseudobdellovibrionaceae bacterium]